MDVVKFLADLRCQHAAFALPGFGDAERWFLDGYGIAGQPNREASARHSETVILARSPCARFGWSMRTGSGN